MTDIFRKYIGKGIYFRLIAGDSTETKLLEGVAMGSLFHEVDTRKIYAFDSNAQEWVLQATLNGGDE